MKNILILSVFFTCMGLKAQVFQTALTSQGWAGGICCRTGVSYNLTITGNAAELEKLVVEAICIDGLHLKLQRSSAVITSPNKTSYRSFSFDFSEDGHEIAKDLVPRESCSDTGRIYLKGNEFLMVESHKRLESLAYP